MKAQIAQFFPARTSLRSSLLLIQSWLILATGFLASSGLAQSDYATPFDITTLAGSGFSISGNGDGRIGPHQAQFNFPNGVALDGVGNLYVADTNNSTIRRIDPSGLVITFAGTVGTAPSTDGTGTAARFSYLARIAADSNGNLYATDGSSIRKITPAGVVTTLAGSSLVVGDSDGVGSAAQFSNPVGIAANGAGVIYVADSGNNTIRRIDPEGMVATLAGTGGQGNYTVGGTYIPGPGQGSADGTGAAAKFYSPEGLAVDGAGNVIVADTGNGTIRKITPAGVVTTVAGTAGVVGSKDGAGAAAQFNRPTDVAVDASGNYYVVDSGNCAIREVTPAGVVTTLAGGGRGSADGTGSAAEFLFPSSLAIDAAGIAYVSDTENDTIRQVTAAAAVSTFAGTPGNAGSGDGAAIAATFNVPAGVAVDSAGNIYVADTGRSTIRIISPAGQVSTLAGSAYAVGSADGMGSAASFNSPEGVAVDGAGTLYVADTLNNTIRVVSANGKVTTLAGMAGQSGSLDGVGSAARFYNPYGVAVDNVGNVYVADGRNDTVRKISANGAVSTLAGAAGSFGLADGVGSLARFEFPWGIAVDGAGNVYVSDSQGETIRKITPVGLVTTLAGGSAQSASADGIGGAAGFHFPSGLAVDKSGNVYVADSDNSTIRKITPTGIVTTLAGLAFSPPGGNNEGEIDGVGSAARFTSPEGIALDDSGNLYVADTFDYSIREGVPATGPTAPPIAIQPESQEVNRGSTAVLTGSAPGASSYQWYFNGTAISDSASGVAVDATSGANGPQLMITNVTSASNGSYFLIATNSVGWSTSNPATLQVETTSAPGYVANISSRAFVGTGDGILIGGFYIVGSTSRTVLIQALGPALAGEGVTGVLKHPALTIHDSTGATICSNTGWGSGQLLLNAAAAAYAQPVLQAGSADSEVLLTLPPGGYTAEIAGADGSTGVALCAIYELP